MRVKEISEGANHKAIDIGSINQLSQHSFIHPKLGHTVERKLFVGELLKTTGAELSFMELPAKTTVSFLHKHKMHEEIYIFLKGFGQFQVDDDVFKIQEGSITRVSENGSRTMSNNSDETMIYLVIQATANTLKAYNVSDGYRIKGEIKINQ